MTTRHLCMYVEDDEGVCSNIVSIEIPFRSSVFFGSNAIERVINTSVDLVGSLDVTENNQDLIEGNLDDWEECRKRVVYLWHMVTNCLFVYNAKKAGQKGTFLDAPRTWASQL